MRNFTLAAIAALALAACHHEDNDFNTDTATCPTDTAVDTGVDTADTSVAATCTDSTGTYSVGDVWVCPDGCNTCGCIEADVIASTNMVCDDGGDTAAPPDTGTHPSDTGAGSDTGVHDTGAHP